MDVLSPLSHYAYTCAARRARDGQFASGRGHGAPIGQRATPISMTTTPTLEDTNA
ncbi:hypothetical protein PATSB16_13470 [Pandoraea thiooxydans]|nr:hypothetical protein PATSB16_13470 [Pandoraea thiooxydans]